jgi:hypothetical protein
MTVDTHTATLREIALAAVRGEKDVNGILADYLEELGGYEDLVKWGRERYDYDHDHDTARLRAAAAHVYTVLCDRGVLSWDDDEDHCKALEFHAALHSTKTPPPVLEGRGDPETLARLLRESLPRLRIPHVVIKDPVPGEAILVCPPARLDWRPGLHKGDDSVGDRINKRARRAFRRVFRGLFPNIPVNTYTPSGLRLYDHLPGYRNPVGTHHHARASARRRGPGGVVLWEHNLVLEALGVGDVLRWERVEGGL